MSVSEEIDDLLRPNEGPELVIGLVGPIGADLKYVGTALEDALKSVGYTSYRFRVTSFLADLEIGISTVENPLEERYRSYIRAGNALREKLGRKDAFALLSMGAIRQQRFKITGERNTPSPKTAYILSQFKRPEEIDILKRVYGANFVQVSVHASRSKRVDHLTRLISDSHFSDRRDEYYRSKAEELVNMDEEEEDQNFGQRLRDTFHLADLIVGSSTKEEIDSNIERFIRAFFGDSFVTPKVDEYFSFLARSVALRSADLSRQVGAVIVSATNETISVGCNEVPKFGGGSYWEGDQDDYRDFRFGQDPNVYFKNKLISDLLRRLRPTWLKDELKDLPIEKLMQISLYDDNNPVLKGAMLTDLLEYGRVVHAEMSAIADAARRGLAIRGATLYCTTYPCHNCARHIVSSGIHRVVYIEPFVKSLAEDLYPDSIAADGRQQLPSASLKFEPFKGIAPARYREIFSRGRRKNVTGAAMLWNPSEAMPILRELVPSYLPIETAVVQAFNRALEDKRIRSVDPE